MMNKEKLNYFSSIKSTNDYLLNYTGNLEDYTVAYTDNQIAGKGAKGNKWQENRRKGLAFSLAIKINTKQLPGISLVCGLAIRKTILDICGISTKLKWSNDILAENKKLAGILCESKIYSSENVRLVVGVGININYTQKDFSNNNLPYATSLSMENCYNIDIHILAEELQYNLKTYLEEFKETGFTGNLLEEYTVNCYTLNKEVFILEGNVKTKAFVKSIKPDGSLECIVKGESKLVYSGDVSIRGIYGYAD